MFAGQSLFNHLSAVWPKRFQRGSLGKSLQIDNYVKQAMRKSCLFMGFEPVAFGLLVHCSTWITLEYRSISLGFRASTF